MLCRAALLLVCAGLLLAACSGTEPRGSVPDGPERGETLGTTAVTRAGGQQTPEPGGRTVEESSMSLEDAVGQMFLVGLAGTQPDPQIEALVRDRNIGGVLLLGHNMESEGQTAALVRSLQELALDNEPSTPLFVAVDQEGGEVSSAPWVTPQPAAAEVGAAGDPAWARTIAGQTGRELRRAGVNTDLAPVVDTGYGAAIGSRSYGEDPDLVAAMGAAAVEGFESAGVVSAAKHFPNHGAAAADSHVDLPVVGHDLETVLNYDLPPFRAAVAAGVPMVMVGHLLYPTIDPERPASLSPDAISLLRRELGFDGVVVTDDLGMVGASGEGSPGRAAVEAVKAGADLLIIVGPYGDQVEAYEAVIGAVEAGEISRGRVEEAFQRVREVKDRYPLYAANSR